MNANAGEVKFFTFLEGTILIEKGFILYRDKYSSLEKKEKRNFYAKQFFSFFGILTYLRISLFAIKLKGY